MKLQVFNRINLLTRFILCGCLGALTTLSMPPWNAIILVWISLPSFLILSETSISKKEVFLLGWSFGFGYFFTSFFWIRNAFFIQEEIFSLIASPSIILLSSGFATYIAFIAIVISFLPRCFIINSKIDVTNNKDPIFIFCVSIKILIFSMSWYLIEFLRGKLLTGFPWNPIGSIWIAYEPILQGASIIGVYGLSLLTILSASSLAVTIKNISIRKKISLIALFHTPLFMLGIWGLDRLETSQNNSLENISIRIIQPNVSQKDKWQPGLRESHLIKMIDMSKKLANNTKLVIWPEAAVTYPLNIDKNALEAVSFASPDSGYLLTGAPRIISSAGNYKRFNSFFAINSDKEILATYDKSHLVPFGEYMPLEKLTKIPQLTLGKGFENGPGRSTVTLPGLPPFSPLICYEIIFSGNSVDKSVRPKWILNLTNDAWFGFSSGPYQHLAAAQLRATEEGLPVIRSANTGISAVIDSYGRIIKSTDLGKEATIDAVLPNALEPTFFSLYSNSPLLIFSVIVIVFLFILSKQIIIKIKKRNKTLFSNHL